MVSRVPRQLLAGRTPQMRLPPAPAPGVLEPLAERTAHPPWPRDARTLARLHGQLRWIIAFSCLPQT